MKLILLTLVFMMGMLNRSTVALVLDMTIDKLNSCSSHARLVLFAAFHYDKGSIQEILLPLISYSSDPFTYVYIPALLDNERAEALWSYAKSLPHLHWLLLPFESVMLNRFLARLIGMDLEDYHPGVIYLESWSEGYFDTTQLRIILRVLGPHPEYCGDYETYSLSKQFGYHNDWELSADVECKELAHMPDEISIFQVIDDAFRSGIEQRVIHTIGTTVGDEYFLSIVNAYNRVVQQTADWQHACQFLLAELKVRSTCISKARKAMWQLKFLLLVLKSASRCEELVPIPKEKLDLLVGLIEGLGKDFEYRTMPPFLIRELADWLGKHGIALQFRNGNKGYVD